VKTKTLLLLLVSNTCSAGLISFGVNDIPIARAIAVDPKYTEAACRAQEAFLIQIGFASQLQLATNYANDQVDSINKRVGNSVAAFIDKNTPLRAKDVFLIAAIGYTALVKKQVTQGFRDPLFSSITHVVSVGEQEQSFATTFSTSF